MVLPRKPFVLRGSETIETVAHTPRWSAVEFSDQAITQPEERVVIIAYHARTHGDGRRAYAAWCTTTYHATGNDDWRVVQHHKTAAVSE